MALWQGNVFKQKGFNCIGWPILGPRAGNPSATQSRSRPGSHLARGLGPCAAGRIDGIPGLWHHLASAAGATGGGEA
jgi:hypothetical protein